MGRDIDSYVVFGFLVHDEEIVQLFGKPSKEVSDCFGNDGFIFHVPWKTDELSCPGEVVNEICVHINKQLKIRSSYVEGGSYYKDTKMCYGIGPFIGAGGGYVQLETLMKAEQDASEIGEQLRLLGFEVEGGPTVFSLWLET